MKEKTTTDGTEAVTTVDVNEVACIAVVQKVCETKIVMPDAAPTLDAIELVIKLILHSLNESLDRDILISVRPTEGVVSVASAIVLNSPDGGVH